MSAHAVENSVAPRDAGVALRDAGVALRDAGVALRDAGLARLKSGDLSEAAILLGRAVAADAGDARAQFGLGVALQRAGAHPEALEAFERAEALLPGDAASPLHASFSLLALGKPTEGLRAAERAMTRSPHLAEARLMQARALLALGQPERAEQALATLLEQAPRSVEAWKLIAAARRARGEPEAASAAMAEASRLQSDGDPRRDDVPRATASPRQALNAWRPTSQAAALGLAVEYLSLKPAFAALPFGEWSQVLFHQVARGHYLFIVDGAQRIHGFLGWALTDRDAAEAWVEGRAGLVIDPGVDGDCVILNAWAADSETANRFLRRAAAKLFGDRRALYFKRHYADGRVRPVRLLVAEVRRKSAAQGP